MATIDADAHVVECDETWTYLGRDERALAPVRVTVPNGAGGESKMWVVDRRLVEVGPVSDTDAVQAVRELADVDARLQQMDEIGTDVQVLFPTMFLRPVTTKVAVERALCRAYNRWMADRTAKAADRLRWVVVPPTMTPAASLEEVRFGHEHGASGVFWRGFENGRLPSDPYFAPLLAEVDRLGLALCIHAANGTWAMAEAFPQDTGIWRFKVPGLVAFEDVLSAGLAARYPRLRFGFIELSAQWVPYVLNDFVRRQRRFGRPEVPREDVLAEHRVFVACQTDDNLAELLPVAGPDNLVAGTDFGHADTSSELLALQRLRQDAGVAPELIDRILDANPRALYGVG